jgi:O-acetyl-ADP-ribose deacetylase (regulator of RNase III)
MSTSGDLMQGGDSFALAQRVSVTCGDITRVTGDAVMTLINSRKNNWYGGVDLALKRVAGERYYEQAAREADRGGLRDSQVVIASGSAQQHQGAFDHVVFVVNDLVRPLGDLVVAGIAAAAAGIRRIALPAMRTGVMLGSYEPTVLAAAREMHRGVNQFFAQGGPVMAIVVYHNSLAQEALQQELLCSGPAAQLNGRYGA